MLKFEDPLKAWNSEDFSPSLKSGLEALAPSSLPLHLGVSQAGMVDDAPITVTVLGHEDGGDSIQARIGIFFTEIVINCGCGDDPMPINSYCEFLISIDKATAEATMTVIPD